MILFDDDASYSKSVSRGDSDYNYPQQLVSVASLDDEKRAMPKWASRIID